VHLTARELAHHGAVFGGPGSGKTTFLQLLVDANVGRMPCVVVDPWGSPALDQTVRNHGGGPGLRRCHSPDHLALLTRPKIRRVDTCAKSVLNRAAGTRDWGKLEEHVVR
jgi:hypothetical protein